MFVNVMKAFSIEIANVDCPLTSFIRDEYSGDITTDPQFTPRFKIEFDDVKVTDHSYVVRPPVAYDRKGIFIFDHYRNGVRINFDKVAVEHHIVTCNPKFVSAFFANILEFLIYLELLKEGAFFCHSAAFIYNGKTIICPAWGNVGKTNLLLSFLFKGATYLADDWSLIYKDGHILSLPKRISLFEYNFLQYPKLIDMVDGNLAPLNQLLEKIYDGYYSISSSDVSELRNQFQKRVKHNDLFHNQYTNASESIDLAFFLTRDLENSGQNLSAKTLSLDHLLVKVRESLVFEQRSFRMAYSISKGFDGVSNPFLEREEEVFSSLAHAAFATIGQVFEIDTPSQLGTDRVHQVIKQIVG